MLEEEEEGFAIWEIQEVERMPVSSFGTISLEVANGLASIEGGRGPEWFSL